LVVDDIPANLDVARGMLKPYAVHVDCAGSGRQAVNLVREEKVRYDAIFMDHMMPDMDGVEAVRVIREEIGTEYAINVPVIALTANAVAGNEQMFLRNGFQAFLSKPVDIKRLDDVMKRWIRDTTPAGDSGDASEVSGNTPERSGNASKISGDTSEMSGAVSEMSGDASEVSGTAPEVSGTASEVSGTAPEVSGAVSGVSGNASEVSGAAPESSGDASESCGGALEVSPERSGEYDAERGLRAAASDGEKAASDGEKAASEGEKAASGAAFASARRIAGLRQAGMDLSRCLARFGGDGDAALQALRSYFTGTPALLDRIRVPSAQTLREYTITVHGIKGSSFGICADPAGKAAEELEHAAQAGDLAFIGARSDAFLKTVETLLAALGAMLHAVDAEKRNPRKEEPDAAVLRRLRDACAAYDMDGADTALAELERFSYERRAEEVVWLRERIGEADFARIAEHLAQ
jgi:CheY-like chemotaxis protein